MEEVTYKSVLDKLVICGPGALTDEEIRRAAEDAASSDEISAAASFLQTWGDNEDEWNELCLKINIDTARLLCEWLFRAAHATKNEEYMTIASQFFFQTCMQFFIDYKDTASYDAMMMYYRAITAKYSSSPLFCEAAIHGKRLEAIYEYMKTEASEREVQFFFSDFLIHTARLRMDWDTFTTDKKAHVLQVVNLAVERGIHLTDAPLFTRELPFTYIECMTRLCERYGKGEQLEYEHRLFDICIEHAFHRQELRWLVDKLLQEEEVRGSIARVLKKRVKHAGAPGQAFRSSLALVGMLPQYLDKMAKEIAPVAAKRIVSMKVADLFVNEAIIFIECYGLLHLSAHDCAVWLSEVEGRIPFTQAESYVPLLECLQQCKKKLGIPSVPDIPKLLLLLLPLHADSELSIDSAKWMKKHIALLHEKQYEELLQWRLEVFVHIYEYDVCSLLDVLDGADREEVLFPKLLPFLGYEGKRGKYEQLGLYVFYMLRKKAGLHQVSVQYFKQNKGVFRRIREEAIQQFFTISETDAALEELDAEILGRQEGSFIYHIRSLFKSEK